jgi:hypothetical protein
MPEIKPCRDGHRERDKRGRCLPCSRRTNSQSMTRQRIEYRWASGRVGPLLTCGICQETKSADQFGMRYAAWRGECRPCAVEQNRANNRSRYAALGEEATKRARERGAAIRAERIAMVNAIKLERGCIDCGYNAHPAALHFDHRDPALKDFTIAKSLTFGLPKLLAEIAKCDVRCANCHTIRSVTEGHVGRPRIHQETADDRTAA